MRAMRSSPMMVGLVRSILVIEEMIASTRCSSLSSKVTPSGSSPNKGNFSRRSLTDPIFFTSLICSTKSLRSKFPVRIFSASSSAFFSSTTPSKSFIKPTMSPKPRILEASPSGRNSSSLSSPSPMPMNLMGLPVTSLMLSAAPPRASPSSLVSTKPDSPSRRSNSAAVRTASCPIIASATNKIFSGATSAFTCSNSAIISSSMARRPAVS